jgi:hypothetical protein
MICQSCEVAEGLPRPTTDYPVAVAEKPPVHVAIGYRIPGQSSDMAPVLCVDCAVGLALKAASQAGKS